MIFVQCSSYKIDNFLHIHCLLRTLKCFFQKVVSPIQNWNIYHWRISSIIASMSLYKRESSFTRGWATIFLCRSIPLSEYSFYLLFCFIIRISFANSSPLTRARTSLFKYILLIISPEFLSTLTTQLICYKVDSFLQPIKLYTFMKCFVILYHKVVWSANLPWKFQINWPVLRQRTFSVSFFFSSSGRKSFPRYLCITLS